MKQLPTFDAIAKFYVNMQGIFVWCMAENNLSNVNRIKVYNQVNKCFDLWTFDKNLQVWIFTD